MHCRLDYICYQQVPVKCSLITFCIWFLHSICLWQPETKTCFRWGGPLKIQSERPLLLMRGRISRHCLFPEGHKHIMFTGKLFTICFSFTHTLTHQQQWATLQGASLIIRSNLVFSVLLKDTSICWQEELVIEPPTLQLMNNSLYLLSNSRCIRCKCISLLQHF